MALKMENISNTNTIQYIWLILSLHLLAFVTLGTETIRWIQLWFNPRYETHMIRYPVDMFQNVCLVVKSTVMLENETSSEKSKRMFKFCYYSKKSNRPPWPAISTTFDTPPTSLIPMTTLRIVDPTITLAWTTSVQTTALIPPFGR